MVEHIPTILLVCMSAKVGSATSRQLYSKVLVAVLVFCLFFLTPKFYIRKLYSPCNAQPAPSCLCMCRTVRIFLERLRLSVLLSLMKKVRRKTRKKKEKWHFQALGNAHFGTQQGAKQ